MSDLIEFLAEGAFFSFVTIAIVLVANAFLQAVLQAL